MLAIGETLKNEASLEFCRFRNALKNDGQQRIFSKPPHYPGPAQTSASAMKKRTSDVCTTEQYQGYTCDGFLKIEDGTRHFPLRFRLSKGSECSPEAGLCNLSSAATLQFLSLYVAMHPTEAFRIAASDQG